MVGGYCSLRFWGMCHCWGTVINILSCGLCHYHLKHSLFITVACILHKYMWILQPSGVHQGIQFPYCLLAALCVCKHSHLNLEPQALWCCCLINYVQGCKYKSLDTSGMVFKCAAILWEEMLALIKWHTFISGGFRSCQQWMPHWWLCQSMAFKK